MKVHLKKNSYTFCFDRHLYSFLSLFTHYETADKIASKFHAPLLDHLINKPLEIFNEDVIIIDYYDTWNCDTTLAKIIVPLLVEFRKNLYGCPCHIEFNDVPIDVALMKSGDDPTYMRQWEWILDEIIWAFKQHDGEWEDQFYQWDKTIDMPGYGLCRNTKFDKEGYQKYQKRIQNGHRLFGKYLQSIWN